jgi:hypothetical protein
MCRGSPVHAIALEASHTELLRLEEKLVRLGVEHRAIREPDAPFFGELVAIGVVPKIKSELYTIFKRFKLIK